MSSRNRWLLAVLALELAACGAAPTNSPMAGMTPVTEAFKTADANHDEQLTPEEFAQLPYSGLHFADVDTDRNGSVSLAELRSYVEWRRIATAPPRLDERGGSIRR